MPKLKQTFTNPPSVIQLSCLYRMKKQAIKRMEFVCAFFLWALGKADCALFLILVVPLPPVVRLLSTRRSPGDSTRRAGRAAPPAVLITVGLSLRSSEGVEESFSEGKHKASHCDVLCISRLANLHSPWRQRTLECSAITYSYTNGLTIGLLPIRSASIDVLHVHLSCSVLLFLSLCMMHAQDCCSIVLLCTHIWNWCFVISRCAWHLLF